MKNSKTSSTEFTFLFLLKMKVNNGQLSNNISNQTHAQIYLY